MDMILLDVTEVKSVKLYDEVVLIGKQGEEAISATDMAQVVQTINYEITCNISKRVPRIYK